MKKLTTLSIILATAAAINAQTAESPKMNINLNNGTTVEYILSDIKDITFSEGKVAELPVSFAVPNSFNDSYVLKIMAGGKQVAEVDKEYVKGAERVTVVYPCDANGKAILTKGIIADTGATVSWDAATKLPSVGEAATAINKFYIVEGELKTEYVGDTQEGTVVPDVLSDRRGTELQTYKLTKIGLRYWTAENLRTTKYTDGTDITAFSETQTADWNKNTTGCYLIDNDADWVKVAGLLYNGYIAVGDKTAPEGWRVPTCADYADMRTSVGARTSSLYKDDIPGTWSEGNTGNNKTGFSVVATGYFSSATGLNQMLSEAYIWTSDSSYDALSKANAIDYFRVTATGTNAVFPTKGLNPHSYSFGHSIRLVRE